MNKFSLKAVLIGLLFFAALGSTQLELSAHCEVPCGIYDDSLRVALIKEHISTIEKAMDKIEKLSAEEVPNWNQLVRWVDNKEQHATEIQSIVSQYFMHQRIKPADPADKHAYQHYIERLDALHRISVFAMKAKQGIDKEYISKLRAAVARFEEVYFGGHSH